MTHSKLPRLRRLIAKSFSLDQLKTLCQDLSVTFDNLPGENNIESKARELLDQLNNLDRVDELVQKLRELRPKVDWIEPDPSLKQSDLDFPIHELPLPRNPNLTGREALFAQLHDNLTDKQKAGVPQALVGLGGVGKTQAAVEYAYRHAAAYDLMWWIRAETAEALTADYIALANRLQLAVKTGAEQTVFVNIVHHWLKQTAQRWLLIFDNADEPEKLQDFLPYGERGHVIITSQNPNWSSVAAVLRLGVFTPDEAQQFLKKRTGQADEEAAGRLAEAVGYLPLALEQASAFIGERGTSLNGYLKLFQEQRKELWEREHAPANYRESVTTTWELAFHEVRQVSEAAIELLNICTFLAPEEIPISLFAAGIDYLPPTLAQAIEDPFGLEDAIAALYRYSLVQRSGDTLSIHRLVQDVAHDRLGTARAQSWAEISLQLMYGSFAFDKYDLATWPASALLLAHVYTAAEHAEKYQSALETTGALWQKAAKYLRVQGEFVKAQDAVERALALRQAVCGKAHPDTAESMDYLGELLQEQARYERAKPHHERALAIREQALGPDHPDTAYSLNNLASLLRSIGDYAGARPYHERALAIREQALGPDHPDTAISLNNLGYLLQSMGDYAGARPYHERALAIFEQALGPDHPDTAISLNNLGSLLQSMGDYAGARPYFERALAIFEQALGPDHPSTAYSLNNLGSLLQSMGDYAGARPYFERALAIREQALGPHHPDTAHSLNNLGSLLQSMGDYAGARPYYERALAIQEQALGSHHPSTAHSLNNLGYLLQSMGDYAGALPYYERALAIQEQALGPHHPDTAISLNNKGTLLFTEGKYVAARPVLERALKIYEQIENPRHPKLVPILFNLGSAMLYLRQFVLARDYLQRAREICKSPDVQYDECQQIEQMWKRFPGKIGRPKKRKPKKNRKKKR